MPDAADVLTLVVNTDLLLPAFPVRHTIDPASVIKAAICMGVNALPMHQLVVKLALVAVPVLVGVDPNEPLSVGVTALECISLPFRVDWHLLVALAGQTVALERADDAATTCISQHTFALLLAVFEEAFVRHAVLVGPVAEAHPLAADKLAGERFTVRESLFATTMLHVIDPVALVRVVRSDVMAIPMLEIVAIITIVGGPVDEVMSALAVFAPVQVLAAVDVAATPDDSTVANRNVFVFAVLNDLFLVLLSEDDVALELAEEVIEAAIKGGPVRLHKTALALRPQATEVLVHIALVNVTIDTKDASIYRLALQVPADEYLLVVHQQALALKHIPFDVHLANVLRLNVPLAKLLFHLLVIIDVEYFVVDEIVLIVLPLLNCTISCRVTLSHPVVAFLAQLLWLVLLPVYRRHTEESLLVACEATGKEPVMRLLVLQCDPKMSHEWLVVFLLLLHVLVPLLHSFMPISLLR